MNRIKHFDPQGLAHVELGANKLNTIVDEARANRVVAGKGILVTRTGNGTVVSAITRRNQIPPKLPFEISASTNELKAAPGTLCDITITETIKTAPADGYWLLQGHVTIDADTGDILTGVVEWTQTEGTNTDTDFYTTIGFINVVDSVPVASSIYQYNYGPILGIVHGAIDQKWGLMMF